MKVPVVYFVSPQLWAWKQRRIWRVKRFVDRMLVIFPFERDYYLERGVGAEYVGHPLADLPLPQISREAFAAKYGIDHGKVWIALLPGSRRKEVLLNLPAMLDSARRLGSDCEYLLPVASTLSSSSRKLLPAIVALPALLGWLILLLRSKHIHFFDGKMSFAALAFLTMALLVVVVYRVSALTYGIGRRLVKVKNYGMVNLIAGREIVPELIQSNFTGENVAKELRALLAEGQARADMMRNLQQVGELLRGVSDSQGQTAMERAARAVEAAICVGPRAT